MCRRAFVVFKKLEKLKKVKVIFWQFSGCNFRSSNVYLRSSTHSKDSKNPILQIHKVFIHQLLLLKRAFSQLFIIAAVFWGVGHFVVKFFCEEDDFPVLTSASQKFLGHQLIV